MPALPSSALIVNVIVFAVGVTDEEEKVKHVELPTIIAVVAVTLTHVLNWNPEGALNTIVPDHISLCPVSAIVGPTNAVYVPLVVSAEMLVPFVAGVIVAVAKVSLITERKENTIQANQTTASHHK